MYLEILGKGKGLLGLIFMKSQNKFQDPAKLRRLIVDLIDSENWSVMSADVKGDAYEGLLEKNAQDTKTGTRPAWISSGLRTKASKNLKTFLIPASLPRKSSKTSKPL